MIRRVGREGESTTAAEQRPELSFQVGFWTKENDFRCFVAGCGLVFVKEGMSCMREAAARRRPIQGQCQLEALRLL